MSSRGPWDGFRIKSHIISLFSGNSKAYAVCSYRFENPTYEPYTGRVGAEVGKVRLPTCLRGFNYMLDGYRLLASGPSPCIVATTLLICLVCLNSRYQIPCHVPVANFPSLIGIVRLAPTSADLM